NALRSAEDILRENQARCAADGLTWDTSFNICVDSSVPIL
ncbi:MAG: hypothetical protein RLZZ70_227, partial [Candidatus Parcubacteria bacterium]